MNTSKTIVDIRKELVHQAVENVLQSIADAERSEAMHAVDVTKMSITVRTDMVKEIGLTATAFATVKMRAFSRVSERDELKPQRNGHSATIELADR